MGGREGARLQLASYVAAKVIWLRARVTVWRCARTRSECVQTVQAWLAQTLTLAHSFHMRVCSAGVSWLLSSVWTQLSMHVDSSSGSSFEGMCSISILARG